MVALSFLRNLHTVFRSGFPQIYIPTNSVGGRFPFLHAFSSICCLHTFWWWPFWPVWYITVVLICVYLIISDVGHLFTCLLTTRISSLEKYLFRASAHFLIGFFVFWLFCCMKCLYVLEIKSLLTWHSFWYPERSMWSQPPRAFTSLDWGKERRTMDDWWAMEQYKGRFTF